MFWVQPPCLLVVFLLMFTVSGGNVTVGVDTLVDYGVETENIFILTLFATPRGTGDFFITE